MISQGPHERSIREAAAEWAVLLSDGEPDEQRHEALQHWLQADVRHAEALAFAQRTWQALATLPAERHSSPRRAAPVMGGARSAAGRRSRWRRWSAAACLLLALGVGVEQRDRLLLPLLADHRTVTGEVRSLILDDGSEVILDSSSAIRVDFSPAQRRIELLAGSAIFQVAPQVSRPFIVTAAGGSAQALGTRFIVDRQDDQRAWVGVLEHAVEVRAAGQQRRVEEGESVRYSATELAGLQVDLQRATGWQRGVLVFDRVPLQQVVEQLNRYRSGHILISDKALAQREVSGVFRLDALDSALATLTAEMKLQHTQWLGFSLIY